MFMDPFTNNEDIDSMIVLQAQQHAEEEQDAISLTRNSEDYMTATKKVPTKKVTPAAKPAASAAKPAASAAKPVKPAKEKKSSRAVPEGYIGLADLAKEFKTDAGAIRRKLRSSDIPKPEGHGWAFKDGSRDLAAVRKLLTPEVKAEK